MIGLAHPNLLHLVALLPAVAGLAMLLWGRRRRQAAEALGDPALVRRLAAGDLAGVPTARLALVLLASLLLGVAAVGPTWGVEAVSADAPAGDVALVLDASGSMRVEDVAPSRLERERQAARELLRELRGARVALVVFAGRGFVVSPLTSDFSALELYLDELSPEDVTQGGSSLSSAIEGGLRLLVDERGGASGAVVLVSDGDALEDPAEVERAARLARRLGVPLHTVGIGTREGGRVPDLDRAGKTVGFKVDPETGETVVSRLGDGLLREVARRSGGTYRAVARPGDSVAPLAALLRAETAPSGARAAGTAPGNRYEWFLGAALALLALDLLLAERGNGRVQGTGYGRQPAKRLRRREKKTAEVGG